MMTRSMCVVMRFSFGSFEPSSCGGSVRARNAHTVPYLYLGYLYVMEYLYTVVDVLYNYCGN